MENLFVNGETMEMATDKRNNQGGLLTQMVLLFKPYVGGDENHRIQVLFEVGTLIRKFGSYMVTR